MTREEHWNMDKLVVGGLHREDFLWAAQRYEELGYVLIAYVLDRDGYHWKAVYVKPAEHKDSGVSLFGG